MTQTFAQFAARIIDLLKEAKDTEHLPDRIIALSKLRACANDYLGDIMPDRSDEFKVSQAQVAGKAGKQPSVSAKKQAVPSGQLF